MTRTNPRIGVALGIAVASVAFAGSTKAEWVERAKDIHLPLQKMRAEQKLGELTNVECLNRLAEWMANDLASSSRLSHEDSKARHLRQRLEDEKITFELASECLARGTKSGFETITGWMNSPKHRASLVEPKATEYGVGYAENPNDAFKRYWVIIMRKPIPNE